MKSNPEERSWYDRLSFKAETTLFEPLDEIPGNEDWRKDGALPTLTPFRASLCCLWVASVVGVWFIVDRLLNTHPHSATILVSWLVAYDILSVSVFILYILHKLPIYLIKRKHKIALGEWRRMRAQAYIDSVTPQHEKIIYIERFDAPSQLYFQEFLFLALMLYCTINLYENAAQFYALLIVFIILAVHQIIFHTSLLLNYINGFFVLTESRLAVKSGMHATRTVCINLTDISETRLNYSYGIWSPKIAHLCVKSIGQDFNFGYSIYNRGYRIHQLLKTQIAIAREKAGLQPLVVESDWLKHP